MREVRMTFGEHLEELRWRLIVSILYLFGGVTIAFIYGKDLMTLALGPHYEAFSGAQRDRQIREAEKVLEGLEPLMGLHPGRLTLGGQRLLEAPNRWQVLFPLGDRLRKPFEQWAREFREKLLSLPAEERDLLARGTEELGAHLAVTLEVAGAGDIPSRFRRLETTAREIQETQRSGARELVGWGLSLKGVIERLEVFNRFLDKRRAEALRSDVDRETLYRWAQTSKLPVVLGEALEKLETAVRSLQRRETPKIMVISYIESFSMYLRVAFIFGALFAAPFILYELWKFVGAGLHLHEQRYVVTFLPFSLLLFAAGLLFGYFGMIPVGLRFLASWGTEDFELGFTLGNYIGLFLTLTLILGVVFQTPLVMLFLAKLGIMSVETFKRARRIAIFIGVCLAVVLTPPDPFSWSLMALPMIFLYELGILVCRWMTRTSETGT